MGPYFRQTPAGQARAAREEWRELDGIIQCSSATPSKEWYDQTTYCPFGLPVEVFGQAYKRRYHIVLQAIAEMVNEESVGVATQEHARLQKLLRLALFARTLIELRGVALHIPNSHAIYRDVDDTYYSTLRGVHEPDPDGGSHADSDGERDYSDDNS